MSLVMEPVQQQLGANDCGFFAIANLVEVLVGGNPAKVCFNQTLIREHFVSCLESGKWLPFPKTNNIVRLGKRSTKTVKVLIMKA